MFAVTADDLLLIFRQDVSDDAGYSADNDDVMLWKDAEIYRYMTSACDALAKDTNGLFKLVLLAYTAGNALVRLPRYVLHIREARDVTQGRPIFPYNANNVEYGPDNDYGHRSFGSSSMFDSSGLPCSFVRDYEKKALRLVPIPNADGQLELQCTVTLQAPMEPGITLPFEDPEEQNLLLEYMKYLAYRKQDVETEDLTRSRKAKDAYDEGVAERKSKLASYRRVPGVVRMEGW